MDINDIIKRCVDKDPVAEKQLYYQYAKKVYGISKAYIKDDFQAKDCMQDSFIKIFLNLHTYDLTKNTFDAWLSTIVRNTALSTLKKKNIKVEDLNPNMLIISPYPSEQEEKEEDPKNPHKKQLTSRDVVAAIEQLPSGYFDVANLALIEQWKHKDIAKSLNIAESSSRSKLTRAKKLLRAILTKPFI